MTYRKLNSPPTRYSAHWSPVIRIKGGQWTAEFRHGRKFRAPLSPWAKLCLAKAYDHAYKLNCNTLP